MEGQLIRNIHIETTSKCNARCTFCTHKDMKRPKEHMKPEVFQKIVDDLRGWYRGAVYPFFMGEMFMDPDIFDRMDVLAEFVSGFNIFTNGGLLTEERIQRLSKYNIGSVQVSLQSTNPTQHRMFTGLKNWNHVLTMIQRIEPVLGIRPGLIFNDYLSAAECTKISNLVGATPIMAYTYTWREKIDSHHKAIPQGICKWLNTFIFIQSNGNVVPCCMDMEGEGSVGNVMDTPILELWKRLDPLRVPPRGQHELCKNCNMN